MKAAKTAALCAALLSVNGGDAALVDGEPKQYPVSKVVKLLNDMKKELETEAEKDEEATEKMDCWCKGTQETKEQAIKDATQAIPQLEGSIESAKLATVRLEQEIKTSAESLDGAKASLSSSETQHEKSQETLASEQEELEKSVKALEKAEAHLQKGSSFLASQQDVEDAAKLASSLQKQYSGSLLGVITPHQRNLVLAAVKESAPGGSSKEIVGVITSMKDTFKENLDENKKKQSADVEAFKGLTGAKREEIEATQQSLNQKQLQMANEQSTSATDAQTLEDTKKTLDADKVMLADVKQRCEVHTKSYEKRVLLRNEEIAATSKAIAILSDDSARDLFSKSLNFLQTESKSSKKGVVKEVEKAAQLLQSVATKVKDKALAAIASSVHSSARLDADQFEAVIKALEQLKTDIKEKKKEETKKVDSCVQRKASNTQDTEEYTRDKTDAESQSAGLKSSVKEITTTIETAEATKKNLQESLVKADEARKKSKDEYEETAQEQQETQRILGKAITVLEAQFSKKSFVQVADTKKGPADMPEQYKSGVNSAARGGGILALLREIQRDAKVLEEEAHDSEKREVEDHKSFTADTEKSIETENETIMNQNQEKATTEEALLNAKEELNSASETLEGLSASLVAIKQDCDSLQANFEIRQDAYDQELEALAQAKTILSTA